MTPAEAYANWRTPLRLAESPPLSSLSEIELQARWFAGQFPSQLTTTSGERVEIIHRGVWNREPGPDFCEAVIQIAGQSPQRGSIELDRQLHDWENHGHATNPAFNDVVLHLFLESGRDEFFTRTAENHNVSQVRLPLDRDELPFTYPPTAQIGRCSSPLATLSEDARTSLIEAAAHFRLQKKAERFARLASAYGWDEALFQQLAIALGYKANKLPFELLAQRVTLQTLRDNPANIDSLLFGCAGFLDATTLREFSPETQDYLRSLWERWWKLRAAWQRLILPRSLWKITSTRPANHPQRRLAALGCLAKNWPKVSQAFREPDLANLEKVLGELEHDYWSEHYTISSRRSTTPVALLGGTRIVEMFINVAIPAALGHQPDAWKKLAKVRQPLENRKLKTGILRLFGDEEKKIGRIALQQQGILQIYEDFCLRDLTDCARCPFPEKVLQWGL